ncbi:hypothetical protein CEP52_012152 [Fusarium oligoseptatum]|uniref:Uncharacterized protein n=1 Tax=Fusarium oligoseptatum TaxID=2604345 RepID=A0A428SZS3_9HYPO|nr:hypothetical protein CEP52_012152 [Fusarium oligoseptatum]
MSSHQEISDDIRRKVFAWLKNTRYAAFSLEPLIGGQANFTYHAKLLTPLEDGTTEVVVKHGEPYMARHPANEITTHRCRVEAECLMQLNAVETNLNQLAGTNCTARTPRCFYYEDDTKTQIHEYLPNTVDLKTYIQKHFSWSTPNNLELPCRNIGKTLADYISSFHLAGEQMIQGTEAQSSLKPFPALRNNEQMQSLKHMINYDWLLQRIDQFPEILSEARDVFYQVKLQALLESDAKPIHGDFCPQNILLPDAPLDSQNNISLFIVDWENAQLGVENLDHGEMIGELYSLWLSQKTDAALWVMQGYSDGLGPRPTDFIWRLAVQVGVHLLSFGTFGGTASQSEDVARHGKDIMVNAWKKNRAWFEECELSCLFARAEE